MVVLASAGCWDGDCTAEADHDPATIFFEPPITESGTYEFQLTANGATDTCQAQLWTPPEAVVAGEGGADNSNAMPQMIRQNCSEDDGVCLLCNQEGEFFAINVTGIGQSPSITGLWMGITPERARLMITRTGEGEVLFDGEVEFTYQSEYPNGRACGEDRYGEATVELDQP